MKKLSQSLLASTVTGKRKEKKITQQQLADLTGINRGMLSRLEQQDYIPSIEQIEKLGEVLDFEVTDLFVSSEPSSSSLPVERTYRIAVAGTGYVGLSLAVLLSQHHHVTAVDIVPEKVEKINHKISPIQDEYIEKYLAEKKLNLTATTNGTEAYKDADYVIIAAPTNYDSKKNFFDTSAVESVIELVMSVNDHCTMMKYVPTEVRKQLKGTPVFEVGEEMPEFPGGGMSAFMDYIKTNMRYPASAKEKGTQGRVTVQFVVDKDGSIKEPKLLRSVDKDMNAEALRLISSMPKWKPGRQKGQPVAVKYTAPVMFRLDNDKLEKTSSANGITVEGYAGNGKEPLYIVDGKEVTPSVMSALNPDKIERVTVLKDKSATELYGEKGKNGVLLITLKQGTPGIVIRRDNEVTENAKVQHNGSLDLIKTIYIDGEKVDLSTKTIDDLIPAENIEGIEVKKEAGGKGEIYITTKKTKAVEKTSVQGNMKVEGKVVDEQGEPIIGAAVLIEGTTTGSVTDVNGNFVLSVPSKDAVLVASYIGMATGKVKAQPKLTITLKSE